MIAPACVPDGAAASFERTSPGSPVNEAVLAGSPNRFTQTAVSILDKVGSVTTGTACRSVVPPPLPHPSSSLQVRPDEVTLSVTGILLVLPSAALM